MGIRKAPRSQTLEEWRENRRGVWSMLCGMWCITFTLGFIELARKVGGAHVALYYRRTLRMYAWCQGRSVVVHIILW